MFNAQSFEREHARAGVVSTGSQRQREHQNNLEQRKVIS